MKRGRNREERKGPTITGREEARVQCGCLLTNCEFVRETLPQRGVWVVRTEAKSVRGVSECL